MLLAGIVHADLESEYHECSEIVARISTALGRGSFNISNLVHYLLALPSPHEFPFCVNPISTEQLNILPRDHKDTMAWTRNEWAIDTR